MQEYVITKQDFAKWCSIPVDELASIPGKKMDIHIHDEKKDVFLEAADMMADEVIANNLAGKPTRWVLATGPNEQFDRFIERVNTERISLKNVYVFTMDAPLDWEGRLYPETNFRFNVKRKMEKWFYEPVDEELRVPEDHRFYPDPFDPDRIDNKIDELGGIDTVFGGVGCKGLVAACEDPRGRCFRITVDEYAKSKTRVVWSNDDTTVAYAERSFGGCYDALPPMMVTIGMKSMLQAKRAVFMITTGSWKQTVIRVCLFSEPTVEYPVTLFPAYVPECIICCDRKTADHTISHNPYQKDLFW